MKRFAVVPQGFDSSSFDQVSIDAFWKNSNEQRIRCSKNIRKGDEVYFLGGVKATTFERYFYEKSFVALYEL